MTGAARLRASEPFILPNLGAEEGRDWAAYPAQPHARVSARLFALLFPATASLVHARPAGGWTAEPAAFHWPPALGVAAEAAVASWLDPTPDALAWLNTRTLADALAADPLSPGSIDAKALPGDARSGERPGPSFEPNRVRLAGPTPTLVERLHDKRFALDCTRALALDGPLLEDLIEALEPEQLIDVEATLTHLERRLAAWPAWTRRRFTLKPRLGSSGRGRVSGQDHVDTPSLRGALPRLARCGGALFEPWLERTRDLSVVLRVPTSACASPEAPEVLASFELVTTRSGVYRGHLGVIDAAGRVASCDPEDARLRAGACAVAEHAAALGFSGPCGVDAFRFRGPDGGEAWRSAVELNARPTMGLVAWGLLQRARQAGLLRPPRAASAPTHFLFALFDAGAFDADEALRAREGIPPTKGVRILDLASPRARAGEPRPRLCLAEDPAALRALAAQVAAAGRASLDAG